VSIFRRRPPPPPSPARWFPRVLRRFLPSLTPPADQAVDPGVAGMTVQGFAPRVIVGDIDRPEDASRERVFVHQVVIPAYTFYHPTIPELAGIPLDVQSTGFTVSTGPVVGIKALIRDPGLVRQQVFGSGRSPGLVAPSYGDAVYINQGGELEGLVLGVPTDGAKVTCWEGPVGGEFPTDFTIDFIAYVDGLARITDDAITFRLRDRSLRLNARVTTQGFGNPITDSAASRNRPIVYGTPGFLSPILHQPFELGNVWFLQLNTPLNLDGVYDGGVQLTNQGEAMSLSDLMQGPAPNPSSYRYFSSTGNEGEFLENEGTWLRLGSKVIVDLRYYAESETTTISAFAIAAGIEDAGTMAADSVDLAIGSRAIETQTYRDVLEDVARGTLSILGFNRLDQFYQRYLVPSHAEDYDTDFTFTRGFDCRGWQVYSTGGLDRRVWEVRVNAGATQQGKLAGIPSLDGVAARAISRERWMTSFVGTNAALLVDDPSAEPMTLDIEGNNFFGDEVAMEEFAERAHDLFGSIHVVTWLNAPYNAETAALELMDRVALSSPDGRMTTGKRGRIISIERNLKTRRIGFGVWTHYSTIPASVVELTSVDDGTGSVAGPASVDPKIVVAPIAWAVPCMGDDDPVEFVGIVRSWPDFPHPMRLEKISAAVKNAQESGSLITVEVFIDEAPAFSVPITIDNGKTKSDDSVTQPVLAIQEIPAGKKVRIQVTNYGDGTATGLIVTFKGVG
jgi:hypothetical protein